LTQLFLLLYNEYCPLIVGFLDPVRELRQRSFEPLLSSANTSDYHVIVRENIFMVSLAAQRHPYFFHYLSLISG
jgi:hypothetical protein